MMTLITGSISSLLQSATSVITKCDSFFITKWCDKCYYKVRQLLQSVTILLQSATGITKCDDYYKVRRYKTAHHSATMSLFLLSGLSGRLKKMYNENLHLISRTVRIQEPSKTSYIY